MADILRKSQGSTSTVSAFVGQKSTLRHYCIRNAGHATQLRLEKIDKKG